MVTCRLVLIVLLVTSTRMASFGYNNIDNPTTKMMNRRLDRLTFRVPDAIACLAFYKDILGMSDMTMKDKTNTIGYNQSGLKLSFQESSLCKSRQSTSSDAYWKIGITVKNLDHAVGFLRLQGILVSKPVQFLDIGYLCSLRDPAGLSIELLQQGFGGDHEDISSLSSQEDFHPIGGQATLAHITIRTTNLPQIQKWSEESMGMRLLSIQPVAAYGFTLYFYSWSKDVLPKPNDLNAVENRPWLWARPYALLEFQHLEGNDNRELRSTKAKEAGPTELIVADEEDGKSFTIDCSKELSL